MEFLQDWEKELYYDIQKRLFNIDKIIINKKYYQNKYDKLFGYPIEYEDIDNHYVIIYKK